MSQFTKQEKVRFQHVDYAGIVFYPRFLEMLNCLVEDWFEEALDRPFSKIHEGQIAFVIYHDEDNDGELKTGLFWRPKEGFAFSNNYNPKGPPKFKKAAIMLEHGVPVEIELNY